MRQVIEKLEIGKAILYKVTVKEGLWIGEAAQVLEEAGLFPAWDFIRASRNTSLIRNLDAEATIWRGISFPTPTWCARISRPGDGRRDGRTLQAEFQQYVGLACP